MKFEMLSCVIFGSITEQTNFSTFSNMQCQVIPLCLSLETLVKMYITLGDVSLLCVFRFGLFDTMLRQATIWLTLKLKNI